MPLGSWRCSEARLGVADTAGRGRTGARSLKSWHVARAVHRLEAQRRGPRRRDEDMLSRYLPQWPGGLPQLDVVEHRRLDLEVAALGLHPARYSVDELVADRRAVAAARTASRATASREREQPQLAAELAVVARARLLEALEVRLEVLGLKNAVP